MTNAFYLFIYLSSLVLIYQIPCSYLLTTSIFIHLLLKHAFTYHCHMHLLFTSFTLLLLFTISNLLLRQITEQNFMFYYYALFNSGFIYLLFYSHLHLTLLALFIYLPCILLNTYLSFIFIIYLLTYLQSLLFIIPCPPHSILF
jgi:hypothetical protein